MRFSENEPINIGEEYGPVGSRPPMAGFQNDTFPSYKEEIDV